MSRTDGDELLPVLDAAGTPTGESASVSEVHSRGLWHPAAHVWLHREGNVLLARAVPTAGFEGGRLGPTCSLHVGLELTPPDVAEAVARRLGVGAGHARMKHVGSFETERQGADGAIDREHVDAYLMEDSTSLPVLLLDPRVIDTMYEVNVERAVELFRDGTYVPAPGFDSMNRTSNALLIEEDLPVHGRDVLLAELVAIAEYIQAP